MKHEKPEDPKDQKDTKVYTRLLTQPTPWLTIRLCSWMTNMNLLAQGTWTAWWVGASGEAMYAYLRHDVKKRGVDVESSRWRCKEAWWAPGSPIFILAYGRICRWRTWTSLRKTGWQLGGWVRMWRQTPLELRGVDVESGGWPCKKTWKYAWFCLVRGHTCYTTKVLLPENQLIFWKQLVV